MDTPQQALDALQREVNLILESTGRLFAAANNLAPEAALARASRLKQQLPVSNHRFHQALDVLDEELQFAKAVMRRDLAVARANSNVKPEAKQDDTFANASSASVKAEPESQTKEVKAEDVPSEQQASQPESASQSQPQQTKSPEKRSSPSLEDGSAFEPEAKKQAVDEEKPAASEAPPSDVKLELDAKAPEQPSKDQADEEKAPDTATFSNTGDLDSLFNDPASAGGLGGDNGDAPDFSTSADLNAEFDFGSFSADLDANSSNDNDNISALLPGLQDYANNTANTDQDFNSIFNTDANANPTDQSNNTGTAGTDDQNGGTQQDTAFDDFFDLTFDMNGDGAENQNGGNSFDFDFS